MALRNQIIEGYKTCTVCGEAKPVHCYHSNGHTIRGRCKDCYSETRKQQSWSDRKNKYKSRNQVKERARVVVRDGVRYGKIDKPSTCPQCGKETTDKDMHGHHTNGYENKLDISWLCRWCHAKEHRR